MRGAALPAGRVVERVGSGCGSRCGLGCGSGRPPPRPPHRANRLSRPGPLIYSRGGGAQVSLSAQGAAPGARPGRARTCRGAVPPPLLSGGGEASRPPRVYSSPSLDEGGGSLSAFGITWEGARRGPPRLLPRYPDGSALRAGSRWHRRPGQP